MCYLYFFCLHCCLINIHIFDYPDSRLSGLFTEVLTSPDNRGSTVQKLCNYIEFKFYHVCPTGQIATDEKGLKLEKIGQHAQVWIWYTYSKKLMNKISMRLSFFWQNSLDSFLFSLQWMMFLLIQVLSCFFSPSWAKNSRKITTSMPL